MAISTSEYTNALADALELELAALTRAGVRICGNALSPVALVKGELNEAELAGEDLLSGADGTALRAALERLGYAPEEFCAISAVADKVEPGVEDAIARGEMLPPTLFREAVEALDPEAVILLDEVAAQVMREAYASELAEIEQFDVAMLEPGLVAHLLGRRVLALGGFEASLSDAREKQRMWAYLKLLPPAGAPY